MVPADKAIFELTAFKTSFIFSEATENILKDRHARVSWWIPIHGSVPSIFPKTAFPKDFSHASFTMFPEDRSTQVGSTPPRDHINRNLAWTPTSLRSLWNFLIEVRKINKCGPITIAYMVKSGEMVYITVGCNAYVALRVRSVLASWEAPEGQDFRGKRDKYYLRLLRPCRLLLVDDMGQPLLAA